MSNIITEPGSFRPFRRPKARVVTTPLKALWRFVKRYKYVALFLVLLRSSAQQPVMVQDGPMTPNTVHLLTAVVTAAFSTWVVWMVVKLAKSMFKLIRRDPQETQAWLDTLQADYEANGPLIGRGRRNAASYSPVSQPAARMILPGDGHMSVDPYGNQVWVPQRNQAVVNTYPVGSQWQEYTRLHPTSGHQNGRDVQYGGRYMGTYTNRGVYVYDPDGRAVLPEDRGR